MQRVERPGAPEGTGTQVPQLCSVLTPSSRRRWTKSHVDRLLHTRYAQEFMDVLDAA